MWTKIYLYQFLFAVLAFPIILGALAIKRESGDFVPLIDEPKRFEHEDNAEYNLIMDKYGFIRRVRSDGNSFYRAFAYAYLESLIDDQPEYNRFKNIIIISKDEFKDKQYDFPNLEYSYYALMKALSYIQEGDDVQSKLYIIFNDQQMSDDIVQYFRYITSDLFKKNSDFLLNFLDGNQNMEEFCKTEIEPMNKDCDHTCLIALGHGLNVGIRRLEISSENGAPMATSHDFPDGLQPRVHLLSHDQNQYDIIYPF